MEINNYRNCINNLINWEFKTTQKEKKREYFTERVISIFSLVSILVYVFATPFILGRLQTAIGFPNYLVDWTLIIFFFVWLWFISPIEKLSKKEREESRNS